MSNGQGHVEMTGSGLTQINHEVTDGVVTVTHSMHRRANHLTNTLVTLLFLL